MALTPIMGDRTYGGPPLLTECQSRTSLHWGAAFFLTMENIMSLRFIQGTLVAATLFGALPSTAAPAIWTEHNDNNRTGANLSETALAPTNVTSASFGALFHQTLDDQSYSQPLYVPGLTMSDG